MVAPTRSEVLRLYYSLLRNARCFPDYNIREFTKRRAADAFQQNKGLTGPLEISAAFSYGKEQFDVAKRQSVVYSLYAPKSKSIMELGSL